ncbi:MAG: peptidoglycan DD-metalloendopeptidase family protein [Saprospiraceae bacterium]
MKKCKLAFWALLLVSIHTLTLSGQTRSELEKKRNALNKELEKATTELNKTKKNKEVNAQQLKELKSQVENRKKMISTLEDAIRTNDQLLEKNNTELTLLFSKEKQLKEQYKKILRSEYLRKKSQSKWTYLLSAENLNNLLLRWRYLNQFENYAKNKKDDLNRIKGDIELKNNEIAKIKESTSEKIIASSENVKALQKEEKEKNDLVQKLSKQEATLLKSVKAKEKQREKLNDEIEKIILAALAKSKENNASTAKREIDDSDFAKNKGTLAWPVTQGKITGKYGTHPHPTIKNIEISNNGVDFTLPKAESVQCIFDGEVVGVTQIPGFNLMVIIRHGSYYSVYSRLASTSVQKGDKIKRGQKIGNVRADDAGDIQLHFEIWKNKTKLNPEAWLKT